MLVIIYSKLLILDVRQKDTKSYRPPLIGDKSAKARLEKATNYMGGGVHDALRVLVI